MAQVRILKVRQVETLPAGFHADGGNLYLRVRDTGSRSWVFRWKQGGRVSELGLGSVLDRGLAEARELAAEMRNALANGSEPAAVLGRRNEKQKTFQEYALELIAAKRPGWRNGKHVQQWGNTLAQYAYPVVGAKRPDSVTLADIRAVLDPLWSTKTETATRLRQRIEAVLDYAAVHEGTERRNPARWRGNLDKVYPAPRKIAPHRHHARAPYSEVPSIMRALRQRDSISALCLRFSILTASRSGEARGATWSEVDLSERVWTVPADRMKARREHRVPLSDEAVSILRLASHRRIGGCPLIFPGGRGGLLSDVAVNKTLHSIAPDVTAHGFRSSFREWGAEATGYSSAVLELALAHADKDKVQAAYQRSDLFDRRRALMKDWADFCGAEDAAAVSEAAE